MMATQSEAHREWHLNSGVPMGQPGCPQDACHPIEDFEPPTVKCGNKAAHDGEPGYHYSAAEVRQCYASTGRFGEAVLSSGQVLAEARHDHDTRMSGLREAAEDHRVWHSTGPRADMGHWEARCPGPQFCVVAALRTEPAEEAGASLARMRAREAEEAERKRREAAARYAAWRTIPVGTGDYANYALHTGEGVVLYQVQRPSTGQYAGKTYVKRHSGDNLLRMGWAEAGIALDRIAADPMAAAVLYGRSASRCAICHRRLTDDKAKGPDGLTSIQRGIGPKCYQRVGGAARVIEDRTPQAGEFEY